MKLLKNFFDKPRPLLTPQQQGLADLMAFYYCCSSLDRHYILTDIVQSLLNENIIGRSISSIVSSLNIDQMVYLQRRIENIMNIIKH